LKKIDLYFQILVLATISNICASTWLKILPMLLF